MIEVVTGFQEQELPLVSQIPFNFSFISLILMLYILLQVNVSRVLHYEGNPGSHRTLTVNVLPLSEAFAFSKFQLQHFSCYILLQQERGGLATEKA